MDEPKQRTLAWFRFYHDALTDHKMLQLSNAAWGYFLKLLCLANQQNPRGSIYYGEKKFSTLYGKILNTDYRYTEKFLKKFEELGLIHFDEENECLVITNWHKRQFDWDDATARKRKSRELSRARERAMSRGRSEQSRTDIKQSPVQNNVSGRENDSQSNDAFKDEKEEETWKKINALKTELKPWWSEVGDFIGKANKTKKHPGSILRALEHCYLYRPEKPFAYAWKVAQVESGNYHYNDFQKEATETKAEFERVFGNGQARGDLD